MNVLTKLMVQKKSTQQQIIQNRDNNTLHDAESQDSAIKLHLVSNALTKMTDHNINIQNQ